MEYRFALLLAMEKLIEVLASLAVDYAMVNKKPIYFHHFTELLQAVRDEKQRLLEEQ